MTDLRIFLGSGAGRRRWQEEERQEGRQGQEGQERRQEGWQEGGQGQEGRKEGWQEGQEEVDKNDGTPICYEISSKVNFVDIFSL